MARPLTQAVPPARWLAFALLACVAMGLAPTRYTHAADWFGSLVVRLAAPVTHPIALFSRWISPSGRAQIDPDLVARGEDAERFRTLYLRASRENEELRDRILDLQSGVSLNPERPISLIGASVIGVSSDLRHTILRTRRGSEVGITPNTVATYRGTRLLGRVVRSERGLSEILPISDRAAPVILARVVLREDGGGRRCTLEPTGDGRLRGAVEDPRERPDLQDIELRVGMLVRLDDSAWPAHAQMLEIGVVERVDASPDNPLRQVIVVRPGVDLARVSEVEFRVSRELFGAGEDGGP